MGPLLVIVFDSISHIVSKGEFTPRYYNPGNFFNEVHILILNDEKIDTKVLQATVGEAEMHIHNLPIERNLFVRSLGYRPLLLKKWAQPAVELARKIKPVLIRCHDNRLNAYIARQIKKELDIPYVVSLHGNPDIDYFRGRLGKTWKLRFQGYAMESVEVTGLKGADHVLPVYTPIIPYLKKHNIINYTLIYNAVGYGCKQKKDYNIDKNAVKCLCVGRQMSLQKDPSPIIDAVIEMPNVSLLLIGDGDLHETLIQKVKKANVEDRIVFKRAASNADILKLMAQSDIYIYSSINYEISKTCIEAALSGMPSILNDRNGDPADELTGGYFLLVNGSKESYKEALNKLINDDLFREQLGCKAYNHAIKNWSPELMEKRVVEIYKDVIEKYKNHS